MELPTPLVRLEVITDERLDEGMRGRAWSLDSKLLLVLFIILPLLIPNEDGAPEEALRLVGGLEREEEEREGEGEGEGDEERASRESGGTVPKVKEAGPLCGRRIYERDRSC